MLHSRTGLDALDRSAGLPETMLHLHTKEKGVSARNEVTDSLCREEAAATQGSIHSVEESAPVNDLNGLMPPPRSPGWSEVVKGGQRRQAPVSSAARVELHTTASDRKKQPGTVPIVGTGALTNIKTVKTKLVSVFATKVSPDLDKAMLSEYLKDKLGHEVTCQKTVTAHNRFWLFKISAECNEIGEM